MKPFAKILAVLVVVFAIVLPMVLKGADGKPIMSPGDWFPNGDRVVGWVREHWPWAEHSATDSPVPGDPKAATAPAVTLDREPRLLAPDSGRMYKWQDESGRWHFSSEKPQNLEGVALEKLPDVENVMDAPVDADASDSMMELPGLGDAGDILKKVQRMASERDQ